MPKTSAPLIPGEFRGSEGPPKTESPLKRHIQKVQILQISIRISDSALQSGQFL